VGHGEDGVKVVDAQEFGLPGLEPPGLGEGLANDAWPSNTWTVRMSYPSSSRWVANEWRSR
jgi:hypothetical protein